MHFIRKLFRSLKCFERGFFALTIGMLRYQVSESKSSQCNSSHHLRLKFQTETHDTD
jgi:hypothetical protein